MATLVGAVHGEYSELDGEERNRAVNLIGADTAYENAFGPGKKLTGTSENDLYFVDNKNTTIKDSGGSDIVVSSVSYTLKGGIEDLILTGDNDLRAEGNDLGNVINGNDGDNRIDGNSGNDGLFGGDGDDRLEGDSGRDTLYGGNDDDTLDGGNDSDSLDGGDGDDRIEGDNGRDTINGGDGDDRIDAGNDSDSVDGGEGNDRIEGDNGRDTINGGEGDDRIDAGNDSDLVDGGAGDDRIHGDSGNDTITGGAGDDTLWGGNGSDQFIFDLGTDTGEDRIRDFDTGRDKLVIDTNGADTFADLFNDNFDDLVSEDGNGNTVIDLGDGRTVTLVDIDQDDLDPGDFIIL